MRRDEIRIFPGNVESHVQRLDQFADSSNTPVARFAPEQSQDDEKVVIDYKSPHAIRRVWLRVLEDAVGTLTTLFLLLLSVCLLLTMLWEAGSPVTSIFLVCLGLLLVPAIWVGSLLVKQWGRR